MFGIMEFYMHKDITQYGSYDITLQNFKKESMITSQ